MEEQFYTIILRHDTSTKWMVNDPVLYLGEYGVEDDTHKVKRGDGESKWSELPYEDFGLQYIVTFENLHGRLTDNTILTEKFEEKVDKDVFEDVSNTVVSGLIIADENIEEGRICDVSRITKNVVSGVTTRNTIIIKSTDKTIQSVWSTDESGNKIVNLMAASSISDYVPGKKYYKDQLCYNANKLYRAFEDITGDSSFNPDQWVLLASLHSNDIKYDNLVSGLDSDNVKGALDELKRRDDRKVVKSTEQRIVYGTTQTGEQTVIPIDDLRKVDTVNHKQADLNKNVQLDASEIKYSDADPSIGTVRSVLDSKVNKTFAGQGARIVRDVQFEYNETTGQIRLIEDKVSPEDGTSSVEERAIDVVSERELSDTVSTLNTRITTEVSTLNGRIDTEVQTLNNTITTKETAIYNRIQAEHDEINSRVDDEVQDLNDTIDSEVDTLNTRIDNEVQDLNDTIDTKEAAIYRTIQDEHNEINTRVTNEVATLNNTIDTEVETLNTTINTKEAALQQQIDTNASEIERVESERTAEDVRIENESKQRDNNLATQISNTATTINGRIDTEVQTLNDRIDIEVQDLNDRIDTEVQDLNDRVDQEVDTLNDTIDTKDAAMDAKKIDKSIAETIVTFLEVATHDSQPTVKITNKNTTTKTANYDYIHFGTQGLIKTRMEDADHLIIDSSDIDTVNTQQNARLTNAESRLTAHDNTLAALQQHDVAHDNMLATHTSQIALHETRLDTDEANITQLGTDLETEATARQNADNALSQRITTNAVNITTKADKEFADDTGDKVVGKLESDTIRSNEIFNLKETMVSPVDNSSSVERIKVISSNNTVIASQLQDGTIDISANLDTDVNYFVTTDIISTTIAAETVLDMNNLTPTDKQVVELQDIISDPEGTWGRVKAIDTEHNECTVVTFKKHAQAVWGTIKGTLADQQDLQNELNALQDNIDAEELARTNADNTKVDKTNSADKVYGTDNNGNQTTYNKEDFGKVDTVNNVQADANKNVKITAENIQINTDQEISDYGFSVDDIKSLLLNMSSAINQNASVASSRIAEYQQGNYYSSYMYPQGIDVQQNVVYGMSGVPCFVTCTRNDGILLMAKVLQDFTSDSMENTTYESFMADIENGYLKLIGIPEQQGDDTPTPTPNWDLYTTVSINSETSSDGENPIVNVYQDLNNIYNVGFEVVNNSSTDELDIENSVSYSVGPNTSTGIFGLNTPNDYTYYDNENAILEELSFQFRQLPNWELYTTVSINSETSSDAENPIIYVYQDTNNVYNVGFRFGNPSQVDELQLSGIYSDILPQYTDMDEPVGFNLVNDYTYYDNENAILEVENFSFIEPIPEPEWDLTNSFSLNSPTSSDSATPTVEVYEDITGATSDSKFIVYSNSQDDSLEFNYNNGEVVETVYPDEGREFITSSVEPYNVDLSYIENNFQFTYVEEIQPNWQIESSFSLNSPISSDNTTPQIDVYYDANGTTTNTQFGIGNSSAVDEMEWSFTDGTQSIVDVSNEELYETDFCQPSEVDQNYIDNNFSFRYITEEEQTFNILDDVLGTQGDTYEGAGGTDEEIEEILDEILGNESEEWEELENISHTNLHIYTKSEENTGDIINYIKFVNEDPDIYFNITSIGDAHIENSQNKSITINSGETAIFMDLNQNVDYYYIQTNFQIGFPE